MIESFYINLDSRPERRTFMEDQFRNLGVTATRIAARTPAEIPAARLSSPFRNAYMARVAPLTPGELACTDSHRTAWRAIVDRGLRAGLVLEDDARLSADLPALLADPALSGDWFDVIKLEANSNLTRLGRPLVQTVAGRTARRLVGPFYGAAAYVITANAAAAALADKRTWDMPVDEYLFNRPMIFEWRVVQLAPALAVQERVLDRLSPVAATSIAGRARPERASGVARLRRASRIAIGSLAAFSLVDNWSALRLTPVPLPADIDKNAAASLERQLSR